ncbi:Tat pathway signal sequence domain protein [Streptomyces sp. NPDC091292]|uniref:Tat pathway signal sequence domain protein n=1 Tax=Streptomyces sp. NPDC091292 TaxID=3365991 RepID=UPI00382CCE81
MAGTALMVAVTLPGTAGAGEAKDTGGTAASGTPAAGSGQREQAPPDGVVEDAPDEGERGTGSDPLTDDELRRAEQIAMAGGLRASARNVEGDRGPERLSTNLGEPDPSDAPGKDGHRFAEIVLYDYKSDAVITRTVDLTTGKVAESTTARGVQPPPGQGELTEAARLLIDDRLGKDLKADYRHATGKQLTDPGQLELSGMVFRKETTQRVPAGLADCGTHRCLRIVVKVKNGPWIDTRAMVVDLSARTVGRLG